jgi:hypothetical protein
MYYLEYIFMPSVDFTDALLEISELSTIADMWERWNAIACFLIPSDYDMRDALEVAEPVTDPEDSCDEQSIRSRMRYLSDRLDPARCYWLDCRIRLHLGMEPRA